MDKELFPCLVAEVPSQDTHLTYSAFQALREGKPAMASMESFVSWVNDQQRPEGYRMLAVFLTGVPEAVAVAGFRVQCMLSRGRMIYIDDLVTLPQYRGRGYAGRMFDWLTEEAKRLGCQLIDLDSGHNRYDAHRFYLKRGMIMNAHHFSIRVD